MKSRFQFRLNNIAGCARLLTCWLMAGGAMLMPAGKLQGAITAPQTGNVIFFNNTGGPMAGDGVMVSASAGGTNCVMAGMAINGKDMGTTLLDTFDLNHDGKVTLAELTQVADACFKLWDTNNAGYLTPQELSAALSQFFPTPTGGGVAVVNGTAVSISADDLPTPGKQITRHFFAAADANKDGQVSLQELNDYLTRNFSQWDQDGDGSLNAQELAFFFGQLARPD